LGGVKQNRTGGVGSLAKNWTSHKSGFFFLKIVLLKYFNLQCVLPSTHKILNQYFTLLQIGFFW
jgi:hypothetical protein